MVWGKADSKTAGGTVSIASNGVVTGSSTFFTTQAAVGDYIVISGEHYLITEITSDTVAKVKAGVPGATLTTRTTAAYALSEKPSYLTDAESDGSVAGTHGDPTKVFGVDVVEATVAANKAKGLNTAGWTRYKTYTDAQGNTRHKAEVLVAMGTITGDAADDSVVADS